jgi:hypothetical protein
MILKPVQRWGSDELALEAMTTFSQNSVLLHQLFIITGQALLGFSEEGSQHVYLVTSKSST